MKHCNNSLKSEFIGVAILEFPGIEDEFPGGFGTGASAHTLPVTNGLNAHFVEVFATVHSPSKTSLKRCSAGSFHGMW